MSEETGGPFVQIAAFCHVALVDNTGAVSVIKIVDRVTMNIPQNVEPATLAQSQPLQTTLVVILKSGFFRGKGTVTIRPKTPSGADMPPVQFPMLFEGDERGAQIVLPIALALAEEGLYWFEVLLDQTILTKVPLRLIHQPAMLMQMGTLPGQ